MNNYENEYKEFIKLKDLILLNRKKENELLEDYFNFLFINDFNYLFYEIQLNSFSGKYQKEKYIRFIQDKITELLLRNLSLKIKENDDIGGKLLKEQIEKLNEYSLKIIDKYKLNKKKWISLFKGFETNQNFILIFEKRMENEIKKYSFGSSVSMPMFLFQNNNLNGYFGINSNFGFNQIQNTKTNFNEGNSDVTAIESDNFGGGTINFGPISPGNNFFYQPNNSKNKIGLIDQTNSNTFKSGQLVNGKFTPNDNQSFVYALFLLKTEFIIRGITFGTSKIAKYIFESNKFKFIKFSQASLEIYLRNCLREKEAVAFEKKHIEELKEIILKQLFEN